MKSRKQRNRGEDTCIVDRDGFCETHGWDCQDYQIQRKIWRESNQSHRQEEKKSRPMFVTTGRITFPVPARGSKATATSLSPDNIERRKEEKMEKLVFLTEDGDEVIAEVEITEEELEALRQEAEEEGVTLEDFIISLLKEFLKENIE